MPRCEMIQVRHSDSYQTSARLWLPPRPRIAVLYLHGIQSHGLWFERSAVRLAEADCAVLLPDRRGSGRNEAQRGHAGSPRRLLRDAGDWLDELHLRTGVEQFHVVGVSWGGKLALALRRYAPQRVIGLTLVAPGLFPAVDLPVSMKVRIILSAATGRGTRFPIPLDDAALFTDNPQRRAFIENDALRLREVTATFLVTSRRLDHYARGAARDQNGCPTCVFLAGRDRIIDNASTRRFFQQLPWPHLAVVEYPDAAHTLEFDMDPEPFLTEMVESVVNAPAEPA